MKNNSAHDGEQCILYVTPTTAQAERFSREMQRETEFDVLAFDTVNDALEILHSRDDIACIVSDYDLPDIDGLAFLQAVRAQIADLPFILFTSEGNEAVASKAITARVTDYLIKEQFQDQWAELATLIQESITHHQSQRSLGSPEVRGKVILEASPESIVILQDDRFRYANTNALSLFEVDTIRGFAEKQVEDFVAPDSQKETISSIEALQAGDPLVDRLDTRLVGQQGTETPVELTAVRIDWQGSPAIVLIFRDISERHERKQELDRQKEKYTTLVEQSQNVISVIQDGEIKFINQQAIESLGYEKSELIGESLINLIAPQDRDLVLERHRRRLDPEAESAPSQYDAHFLKKDGEERVASINATPIQYEGEPADLVEVRDITERVRAEEELAETKERYESLFTSIRDPILVADTELNIINCNPAFTELFGYELAEIEGKPINSVHESEEEYHEIVEALEEHMGSASFMNEASYKAKHGQTFTGETTVSYLRDGDGEVIGYIGVIRDISERKERTKQIQKVDRILQHNFNNDMNVIEGYAQTILEESDEATESQAAKIIEASRKLRGTVKKERSVTKFLAESTSVTTFDIGDQANTIISDMRDEYPDAEIELNIQGDTTGLAVSQIPLAIEELLQNAVTYADTDRPTIRVQVERDQDVVKLSVSDENPEIPEMERAVLVGKETVDPLFHGSGIGLWLVNLIVSHSDGTLEFQENEPRGNVVTIRLPAE